MAVDIFNQADHADNRGGENRHSPGFIVEADIAADDRDLQLFAGEAHAFYAFP